MDHDDIYINEDVTYRSNLLQYINTIINRVYNGQCDRIALEIHSKNKGVLVNLGTLRSQSSQHIDAQERSNAQKNTDET